MHVSFDQPSFDRSYAKHRSWQGRDPARLWLAFCQAMGYHPHLPNRGRSSYLPLVQASREIMAPPLIQLKDIRLTFGGTPLLEGVGLSGSGGERLGVIGRNGSGK